MKGGEPCAGCGRAMQRGTRYGLCAPCRKSPKVRAAATGAMLIFVALNIDDMIAELAAKKPGFRGLVSDMLAKGEAS